MLGKAKDEKEGIEESISRRKYENELFERELNAIQKKFCLNFLSDIKNSTYHNEIIEHLYMLNVNTYPLFLWKRLIQYLTDDFVQVQSLEDVKAYLKEERKVR